VKKSALAGTAAVHVTAGLVSAHTSIGRKKNHAKLAKMEEVAVGWLINLLRFPSSCGGALCSGATIACTTALCAARDKVLAETGWDVRLHGLCGAPAIHIYVGPCAHSSVFKALPIVGLGSSAAPPHFTVFPALPNGAVDAEALLSLSVPPPSGPAIVFLQAGHVKTGAFDDFPVVIA